MGGLEGPGSPRRDEGPPVPARARYGAALFAFYVVAYGGFVLLNAFAPSAMEATPFAGVNLAVLLGLGLIGLAFLLALFYDWLCRDTAPRPPGPEEAP